MRTVRASGQRPGSHPLYLRHHGPQQGRHVDAQQPRRQRQDAARGLALAAGRRTAARPAAIPCARFVRRLALRPAQRQQDDLPAQAGRCTNHAPSAARHRLHGCADLLCASAGRRIIRPRGVRRHAPVHLWLGAAPARNLQRLHCAHRFHHPRALRHERDQYAGVESLRRQTRGRQRRLPAAGRVGARGERPGPALHGE